ncbi:hypothetical protein FSP39_000859 [Pinctada imbricata]|uniref:Protein artemis n=1 Tax=Pinctada imbricata TaxID=66713 RepID=A0AA88Y9M6_PINIB|nr:hypothetical protein FSP39_000859 [Pinctada imbricata]
MLEYQNISIDRFDGINLKSTAFFLSHCHEDHTAGLKDDAFEERLKSRNDIFLYCSDVTQILLGASPKYQHLHKYIRVLPVDKPTVVPVPEADSAKTQDVTVTLIHAGHCPGSVMFLYEGAEGRALYTGDFRWESDKISQISALHQDGRYVDIPDILYTGDFRWESDKMSQISALNQDGRDVDILFFTRMTATRISQISSLYQDSSCVDILDACQLCIRRKDSIYIPPRMECLSVVCSLVSEWLGKDDKNVVHIISKTNYGHEPLFKEVAEHTGHKVHVSLAKCKIYRQIYGLKDTFTQDPEKTRVHACHRERDSTSFGGLPCRDQPSRNHVMRILPSTMFFTMKMRLQQKDVVIFKNGLHRVCYSFHSSLLEVRDLVTYLSPERVRPNVKPLPDKDLSTVQRRLNEFLKMKNSAKVRLEMDSQRPLGLLRPSKIHKPKPRNVSVSSDSEELDFGTQSFDSVRKIKYAKSTPVGAIKEQSSEDENSSYTGSQREDSEISDLCVDNDNGGDDDR